MSATKCRLIGYQSVSIGDKNRLIGYQSVKCSKMYNPIEKQANLCSISQRFFTMHPRRGLYVTSPLSSTLLTFKFKFSTFAFDFHLNSKYVTRHKSHHPIARSLLRRPTRGKKDSLCICPWTLLFFFIAMKTRYLLVRVRFTELFPDNRLSVWTRL